MEGIHEVHDLEKAAAVLGWDRQVNMPRAGGAARVQQTATLRRLAHEAFTSDDMGERIEAAAAELGSAEGESDEACLIRLLRRSHADARKLPPELVARTATVSGEAQLVWERARAEDDFSAFRPHLEQVVALARETAERYGYAAEPYDALLDKFEYGLTTAEVRALFDVLRKALMPLLAAILERGRPPDDALLRQRYDVGRQQRMARYLAEDVGFDFARGHLGAAVHPFAVSFSRDDVRITTRWQADFLSPGLFATLHEAGHGLYEQGIHPALARTPLGRGASAAIHESQSRLIENMVGRSLGFWQRHLPTLRELFPAELGSCTAERFHRAVNHVAPSTIRVEADELTYNLHIILRFDLEQALLEGQLAVADLPGVWREKMRELVGIAPSSDREGVLQDVHWSSPNFGYFPTYALGNLQAAQLWEAAMEQDAAIGGELAAGRPAALVAWLREQVHQHGRKFTPDELIRRATGKALGHEPFLRYVTARFQEVYGL
jgi:carboxypeptidase Taq